MVRMSIIFRLNPSSPGPGRTGTGASCGGGTGPIGSSQPSQQPEHSETLEDETSLTSKVVSLERDRGKGRV